MAKRRASRAAIEEALSSALARKGVEVVPGFTLPRFSQDDPHRKLALFIPHSPPAFVEIHVTRPNSSATTALLRRIGTARTTLGQSTRVFLFAPAQPANDEFLALEHVLFIALDRDRSEAAIKRAVQTIVTELRRGTETRRRGIETYTTMAVGVGVGAAVTQSLLLGTVGAVAAPAVGALGLPLVGAAGAALASLAVGRRLRQRPGGMKPGKRAAHGAPAALTDKRSQPSALPPLILDVRATLLMLADVMGQPHYETVCHEIAAVVTEYQAGHYTATALRAGRAAEAVLYALAATWKVPTDERVAEHMTSLQGIIDQVKSEVVRYPDLHETDRAMSKERMMKLSGNMTQRMNRLLLDLDSATERKRGKEARHRPPEAVLRDIFKLFARHGQVRERRATTEKLLHELATLRNKAAHAGHGGKPSEVDETQVERMLELLRGILVQFSAISEVVDSS